ncbi:nitrous oxide reductase accessory protein NosL [Acidovorax sp. DW039]|uniref:nitrous oxide reductase accessory protein NosL n=1 Tax=Acidovorax sp. DW039 TaxID=3095606 RepID=UPI00308FE848|nr:nitrous oxide reductase accessory protein NosL [Acidovorax sp. DW039]
MTAACEPGFAPAARNRRWALAGLASLATTAAGVAGWSAWQNGIASSRPASPTADLESLTDDVCVVAPPTPYNADKGLPLSAAREVPPEVRCPVCGMYPTRARAWAAQVIFADGDAFFLDSPLSLLMYLGDVPRYTRGRTLDALRARYVTDMESGGWVEATQAMYVVGSSALGPMRAGNLPAWSQRAAAEDFARQRGGHVLAWGEITPALVASLAPRRHTVHALP